MILICHAGMISHFPFPLPFGLTVAAVHPDAHVQYQ
jgi:hypothetical protein